MLIIKEMQIQRHLLTSSGEKRKKYFQNIPPSMNREGYSDTRYSIVAISTTQQLAAKPTELSGFVTLFLGSVQTKQRNRNKQTECTKLPARGISRQTQGNKTLEKGQKWISQPLKFIFTKNKKGLHLLIENHRMENSFIYSDYDHAKTAGAHVRSIA